MSLEQLYNRPCHLVRRLHQISVAIFMECRPGQHVTPVQYATLATVNEYPDLDIRSIANMIAVDRRLWAASSNGSTRRGWSNA